MVRSEEHDLFAIPELWRATLPLPPAASWVNEGNPFHDVDFNLPALRELPLAERGHVDQIEYQQLEDFKGTLQPLEIPDDLAVEAQFPSVHLEQDAAVLLPCPDDELDADILDTPLWQEAAASHPLDESEGFLTWENFHAGQETTSTVRRDASNVAYVSEAGPAVFDVAEQELSRRRSSGNSKANGTSVQPAVLVKSLFLLSLGRAGDLFKWDDEAREFTPTFANVKYSGTSMEGSQTVILEIKSLGESTRYLQKFTRTVFDSSPRTGYPSLAALATVINFALDKIEEYLVHEFRSAETLLQISQIGARPKKLVTLLQNIVKSAKTKKEHVVDLISSTSHDLAQDGSPLSLIMTGIFAKVTAPVIEYVDQSTGLARRPQTRLSQDYHLKLPECIKISVGELIRQCQQSLEFLSAHDSSYQSSRPSEANRTMGFQSHGGQSDLTPKPTERSAPQHFEIAAGFQLDIPSSLEEFQSLPDLQLKERDLLGVAIRQYLMAKPNDTVSDDLNEYFSTGNILDQALGGPLIVQKARLSKQVLRALFSEHHLLEYLMLQRVFSLCQSEAFVSRLQRVLFSPDTATSERQKGNPRMDRNIGLSLGSARRREWPPASSELRLALFNVIQDSWNEEVQDKEMTLNASTSSHGQRRDTTILDHVSFGIREIPSEDDIQKMLEPHSIYALDFLKISFEPPSALQTVFTQSSIDSYDRIFTLMLRLLRVNFTLSQIHRDLRVRHIERNTSTHAIITSFRHAAGTFFYYLTNFFTSYGIAKPWTEFLALLTQAQESLQFDEQTIDQQQINSLSSLCQHHEQTLRRISASLLLRKRQRRAADLLESISSDVLAFAKVISHASTSVELVIEESLLRDALASFEQHRDAFLTACREIELRQDDPSDDQCALGAREVLEALGADL